jgi:TolA-binding protein
MVRLTRWILFLLALMAGAGPVLAANSTAEQRAFDVAMGKFGTVPELSEQAFADFIQKYPNSIRVPEAILYQAQARLLSGQAEGAIQLLATNHTDKLAPNYLYWLGCARFQNNDYAGAADTFGQLLEKFPESPQALDATVREAGAFARLQQWPRLVQLLERTNGLFQQSIHSGAVSETTGSGFLLLGEAQLALRNFPGVDATLHALDKQTLKTGLRWQRDYLASRAQRAEGRLEDALQSSASLLSTQDWTNRAEGVAFQGSVLEQLENLSAAANVYTNNLAPEAPIAQQRLAILKIAELDLRQNKLMAAVQSLTNYLNQFPPLETTDLALLTLGEVSLKQALSGSDTNLTGGETNLFQNALAQFDRLLTSFTNSPLIGKALLDKGWCLWSEGKIAESQDAFRAAVERLPYSEEQAEARFKWADTQFAAHDFAGAVTNYNSIAEKYLSLPEAKEHRFIERALYQSARAALNEKDFVATASALKNILAWYPNGFAGPSALLLAGQGLAEQKDPAGARKLFSQFEELYPGNPLLSEVRLAIARTYEAEQNWDAAITNYDAWTQAFPAHYLMPQAKFSVAWDEYMAGHETNALMLFTNFITRFPTNELSARAQYWAGEFYFRHSDWLSAENNYQLVFQNASWPASELAYQARMMAGRSCTERTAYKQAVSYFTNLFSADCPRDLQVQATMAYADALISQDSTNKTAELTEAIRSLQTIIQSQSNSWQAAQAWGKIGDCFFDLGAKDANQYTNAGNAYRKVFEAPAATGAARNEARFKLGATIEKQAALATGEAQTSLLKDALKQYVDAFYQGLHDTDKPSPLWTKKSGLAAGQIAETLQQWQPAFCIYYQLKILLPVLGPVCDKKMDKALKNGAKLELCGF